jgi:hypothetical protein
MIDWDGLDPRGAGRLLDGVGVPWWIHGDWALERYTAVRRPHRGVEVGVFLDDLPAVLGHFPDVRAVVDGFAVPLSDEAPDRLWVRSDGLWQLDVQVARQWHGEWVFPRDPTVTYPLDDVTWMDGGLRYLNPEFVLLSMADEADTAALDSTLPWLRAEARERFVALLRKLDPAHPWLERI